MSIQLNPNIPEKVRAVASDGTQLRYALMEMAREMDDVIALGRGDPDLETPPHIVEAAKAAIREGRTAQTSVKGMDVLRGAIARHMRKVNGLPVGADNIMVTTGGQEGLFLAIQALIDPGDEILVPDPRYSSYDDAIGRAGGIMVAVPTNREDAFTWRRKRSKPRSRRQARRYSSSRPATPPPASSPKTAPAPSPTSPSAIT